MLRAAVLALLLFATAAFAAAQTPEFALTYLPDLAYRPLARIGPVLDDDALENAARSGIPIRLRVRVELWRDGWTDDLVATERWAAVLAYDPLTQEFLVRGRSADAPVRRFPSFDAARTVIEGNYPLQIRPNRAGRYYYLGRLEIETLSLSDIQELERWLQGELQPAVRGDRSVAGALGDGAKRLMIRLLNLPARGLDTRSARCRVP